MSTIVDFEHNEKKYTAVANEDSHGVTIIIKRDGHLAAGPWIISREILHDGAVANQVSPEDFIDSLLKTRIYDFMQI